MPWHSHAVCKRMHARVYPCALPAWRAYARSSRRTCTRPEQDGTLIHAVWMLRYAQAHYMRMYTHAQCMRWTLVRAARGMLMRLHAMTYTYDLYAAPHQNGPHAKVMRLAFDGIRMQPACCAMPKRTTCKVYSCVLHVMAYRCSLHVAPYPCGLQKGAQAA